MPPFGHGLGTGFGASTLPEQIPPGALLLEDGSPLLLEDGSYLIVE